MGKAAGPIVSNGPILRSPTAVLPPEKGRRPPTAMQNPFADQPAEENQFDPAKQQHTAW